MFHLYVLCLEIWQHLPAITRSYQHTKKKTIRVDPLSFIPRRNLKAQTSYQDIISQTVGGTLVIGIILLLLKNLLLIVYATIYMRKEVEVEAWKIWPCPSRQSPQHPALSTQVHHTWSHLPSFVAAHHNKHSPSDKTFLTWLHHTRSVYATNTWYTYENHCALHWLHLCGHIVKRTCGELRNWTQVFRLTKANKTQENFHTHLWGITTGRTRPTSQDDLLWR